MPSPNIVSLYKPDDVDNVIVGSDFFELIEAINLGYDAQPNKPKTVLIQKYLSTKYEYQNNPSISNKEILAKSFITQLLAGYNDVEAMKFINERMQANKNNAGQTGLTVKDLNRLLVLHESFISHLLKDCKDTQMGEEVKKNKLDKTWDDLLHYLHQMATYYGAVVDPLLNVSNVKNDIAKEYKNAKNITNALEIPPSPKDEEVNTVIVGAGPIGLLNAIGLLNHNKRMKLVILEKYDQYKRNHTLQVDYSQVEKFLEVSGNPPDPAIKELVLRTKNNKYIRISEVEHLLKNRAVELGAHIITGKGVVDVYSDVFDKYKNADLIMGADGTRSVVSQQAIGRIDKYQIEVDSANAALEQDKIYISLSKDAKIHYSMISIDGTEVKQVVTDIDAPDAFYDEENLRKTLKSVMLHKPLGEQTKLQFKLPKEGTKLEEDTLYLNVNKSGKFQYSMKTIDGATVREVLTDIDSSQFITVKVNSLSDALKNEIRSAAARNYHAGNTFKKEFDFVLQFRVEVEGDVAPIPLPTLARFMQNYGLTCDEYVGKTDARGKTPITFQMMITKEHYQLLEKFAKSGNPVQPFSGADEKRMEKIPDILMQQLKGYLGLRLRHFTKEEEIVSLDKATISVNEAPATYAKEVYKEVIMQDKPRRVVLVGDAGLGLSYFKGINAGFEASAKVFPELIKPYDESKKGLGEYKEWFETHYAPQKVDEVRNYSVFRIGLLVGIFKTLQFIFRSDLLMRGETAEKTVDLYLGHLKAIRAEQEKGIQFRPQVRPTYGFFRRIGKIIKNNVKDTPLFTSNSMSGSFEEVEESMTPQIGLPRWEHAYEHDGRSLESVLTFKPQNSWIILREIGKNIKEGFKPYKSWFYALRDVLTPLRSLYNLVMGVAQIVLALPIELISVATGLVFPEKNVPRLAYLGMSIVSVLARLVEGISQIVLGLSLAVSTLFLPFKLISRGISTIVHDVKNIENNNKIKTLIEQAEITLDDDLETNIKLKIQAGLSIPMIDQPSESVVTPLSVSVQTNEQTQENDITLNKPSVSEQISIKKLSSIALDLHQQFEKYSNRYQKTSIQVEVEKKAYQHSVSKGDLASYQHYFGLFKPKPVESGDHNGTTLELDNAKTHNSGC